jgi:hypothetical protein
MLIENQNEENYEFISNLGKQDIKEFLKKVVIGKWSVNPNTGLVDVDGDVDMSRMKFNRMPIKFTKSDKEIDYNDNILTTLLRAPLSKIPVKFGKVTRLRL